MKFSCEKALLLEAVSLASKAVTNKSTIPVLEGLLFEAASILTITGFDLNIGIRTKLDVNIQKEGSIVINAKLISDILRKLPDDVVYFETNDNYITNIRCERAVFDVVSASAEDFPSIPQVLKENEIEIAEQDLKNMITSTIFAVSDNESKPIHTGCLCEVTNTSMKMVAVDGYRLAIRSEDIISGFDTSFVVPGTALREIEKIIHDSEEIVHIYPNEKHILFETEKTMVITRLIEGTFLNYQNAIPQEQSFHVTMDKREFISSVDRVSLIVSEKLKNPIRFHFERNLLQLSCITATGKSYDECSFEGDGEELEIGFNNRYVMDALRACSDEKVKLSLKTSLTPLVISPIDNDKYLYLILPVRLKTNE